jgi:hypothetical protein
MRAWMGWVGWGLAALAGAGGSLFMALRASTLSPAMVERLSGLLGPP